LEIHNSNSLRADEIQLLVFDFDGVMTDNKVLINEDGHEFVTVNRADGLGVSILKKKGIRMLLLSTEVNKVVAARAFKLGIPVLHGVEDKANILKKYCFENEIDIEKVIYVGNDINDFEVMKLVGKCISPSDAHVRILEIVDIVLKSAGGQGVVRELVDLIN